MNELGQHFSPRYPLPSFTRVWEKYTGRVLTYQVKTINYLINSSFNELCLPWTNSADILAQGTSLSSFIMIQEELHQGEC